MTKDVVCNAFLTLFFNQKPIVFLLRPGSMFALRTSFSWSLGRALSWVKHWRQQKTANCESRYRGGHADRYNFLTDPLCANPYANESGAVSVIASLAMIGMIGSIGLIVDLGRGYQMTIANQATADAAALGAAIAFGLAPSSAQNMALLTAEADSIANANGIPSSEVNVQYNTSFNGTSTSAVQVTITTPLQLSFGAIVTSFTSFNVAATSAATLAVAPKPACVIALSSSSNAISLSGGTSLSAANCAVATNASISVSGGSSLSSNTVSASSGISVSGGSTLTSSLSVTYGSSMSVEAGSSVTGSPVKQANSVSDPLAGNSAITSAFAKLGTVSSMTLPSVPTGNAMTLGYYPTTMTFGSYTCTLSNSTWTCPVGTYNFSSLNVGSLTLIIPSGSTVTASGTVTIGGGGSLQIGNGSVTLVQPISVGGGASLVLGSGSHNLAGITVGGGSSVTIGSGSLFVNGSITTAGGSTLTLGQTTSHYINGSLNLSGSVSFGAGAYYINGNFTNNTGGKITGTYVTFVTIGALNMSGGTSLNLSAPTGTSVQLDSTGAIDNVLFASQTTGNAVLGGGSQNNYSGAVYFPNSNIDLSGGVGLSGTSGGCFTVVSNTLTISSGPSATTTCAGVNASAGSSAMPSLVQ